jgi:hypothetical protein
MNFHKGACVVICPSFSEYIGYIEDMLSKVKGDPQELRE